MVVRAVDKITGDKVAIKSMKLSYANDSVPHFVFRELDALTTLSGTPGIVPLIAAHYEQK